MSDPNVDAVKQSVSAITARRNFVISNPDAERVLDITMALAAELAVTQERLDTVERLLDQKALLSRGEVESFEADDAVSQERLAGHGEMVTRILRILHQDIAAMQDAANPNDANTKR